MGGLPRRCRLGECQRHPAGGRRGGRSPADLAAAVFAGGACLLCRLPTLPLAYFSAPLPRRGRIDPQPPSRREGGDFRLFYARGFAPCIPATKPARHWFALPLWTTQWGLASALPTRRMSAAPGGGAGRRSPADLAAAVFAGGACLLCRLPTLPLACFSVPIPPPPLPLRGRGGFRLFLCKGLRPLHPRG